MIPSWPCQDLDSHQLEERFFPDVGGIPLDHRGEIAVAGQVNPAVDRPQEAPPLGGEPATILIEQGEPQDLLV
jgi:hypothetical protein